MKYLREFATEAEYEAFVNSGTMERPNVSYVEETAAMHYTDVLKPGLYIMNTDGSVHTREQWESVGYTDKDSFGVVFIDSKASFIISKYYGSQYRWMNPPALVEGVMATTNLAVAKTDFSGRENTAKMYATGVSPAATAFIENYNKSPQGESPYIGSVGEWDLVNNYRTELDDIMTLISNSNSKISSYSYLTSTQYNSNDVWVVAAGSSVSYYGITKNVTNYYFRAFYPFV